MISDCILTQYIELVKKVIKIHHDFLLLLRKKCVAFSRNYLAMLPIQSTLRTAASSENAQVSARFFKSWPGEYGEWDMFLGIPVPDTRKVVIKYLNEMNLEKVEILLKSEFHEERLAGVLTLVAWAKKEKYSIKQLAEFYMNHREYINNWDLVDTSAEHIIGPYIEKSLTHEEWVKFIDDCIASPHLWTNRIIILTSFYQIKKWNEKLTFSIVPKFLSHPHDLMHKACGWMLREVGKRVNEARLCDFLDEYATRMPRTMLRYAIERLDEEKRVKYMKW